MMVSLRVSAITLGRADRIALTQVHWHPPAQAMIARRRANGDGGLEALRVLKRRLSDVVYRALRADLTATVAEAA